MVSFHDDIHAFLNLRQDGIWIPRAIGLANVKRSPMTMILLLRVGAGSVATRTPDLYRVKDAQRAGFRPGLSPAFPTLLAKSLPFLFGAALHSRLTTEFRDRLWRVSAIPASRRLMAESCPPAPPSCSFE